MTPGKDFLASVASARLRMTLCVGFILFFIGPFCHAQQVALTAAVIDGSTFQSLKEGATPLPLIMQKQRRRGFSLKDDQQGLHYLLVRTDNTETLKAPLLIIHNTTLDSVLLYSLQSAGNARPLYSGGQLMRTEKEKQRGGYTAPLTHNRSPGFYLVAISHSNPLFRIRMDVMEAQEWADRYAGYERLVFFLTGLICMTAAVVLLALVLSRRHELTLFLAYLGSAWGYVLSYYGLLPSYMYRWASALHESGQVIYALCALFFLLLVQWQVFKMELSSVPRLRTLHHAARVLSLFSMALLLVQELLPVPEPLEQILSAVWHTGVCVAIALVISVPLYFYRSGAVARSFLFAALLLPLTYLLQMADTGTFIDSHFLADYSVAIGIAALTISVAFILLYRLLNEKEKGAAQVRSLEELHTDTLKKLISVQDNERRRIASDLHDNIGPLLAALKINFGRIILTKGEALRPDLVAKTEMIIDDAIAEIRNVAHNLMPKSLSSRGLITTLSEYFKSVEQLYQTRVVFNHHIKSIVLPDLQINVYRIVCELVLNAAQHSKADVISVSINADESAIALGVSDNGTGFRPGTGNKKGSQGLQNTRNRVAYLKGQYALKSRPGRGTSIEMEIPLNFHKTEVESF